ncbi:MAG: GNAT family N-acetyltransferase [Bacteroidota bacterium]
MLKTLPPDIRVKQLSDENFKQFHELFNTVFGHSYTVNWLKRKYDTAYLGISGQYLGCLAINEANRAVSYCGHIPFRFQVGDKYFLGAHSCDHMTLEAYRGKGLFQLLNTRAEALVIAAGIPLIFGFPNQNNHPILVRRAQWEIIDTMQAFVFKVRTLPLAGLLLKNKYSSAIYQSWRKYCLRNQSSLTSAFSSVENVGQVRDEAFYTYKQNFRQSELMTFNNGKVWLHLSGHLAIGDMLVNDQGTLAGLLSELKQLAQKLMISRITFLCSSYHPLVPEISKSTKAVVGNGVGVKYMDKEQLGQLPSLLFTYGDYDTF